MKKNNEMMYPYSLLLITVIVVDKRKQINPS